MTVSRKLFIEAITRNIEHFQVSRAVCHIWRGQHVLCVERKGKIPDKGKWV